MLMLVQLTNQVSGTLQWTYGSKKNLPFPDVAGDGLCTACAVKPEPVTAGLGVLGSEFA